MFCEIIQMVFGKPQINDHSVNLCFISIVVIYDIIQKIIIVNIELFLK